jgi:hypothetical protein
MCVCVARHDVTHHAAFQPGFSAGERAVPENELVTTQTTAVDASRVHSYVRHRISLNIYRISNQSVYRNYVYILYHTTSVVQEDVSEKTEVGFELRVKVKLKWTPGDKKLIAQQILEQTLI